MLGSARLSFSSILLVVLVALLLAVAAPVLAAEIRVDGTCALREAIASANRDSGRGGCEAGDGDDVIILTRDSKPGQGQLSRIRTTIVIEGNNHMLELDNDHAAFKIEGGDLTVRNLKIVYYDNTRTRKSFEVYNGKLTLIKVTVENCEVGVQQDSRSQTTIKSNSDICGLPHNELVTGGQNFDINLPVPFAGSNLRHKVRRRSGDGDLRARQWLTVQSSGRIRHRHPIGDRGRLHRRCGCMGLRGTRHRNLLPAAWLAHLPRCGDLATRCFDDPVLQQGWADLHAFDARRYRRPRARRAIGSRPARHRSASHDHHIYRNHS